MRTKEQRRGDSRRNYLKHQEEKKAKRRADYNKQKNDPVFLQKRRERSKRYYQRNKKALNEKRIQQNRERMQKIRAQLGNECCICKLIGTTFSKLLLHQIEGKNHDHNTCFYENDSLKEFVLLCKHHHKGVHFCMEVLNMSWKEIIGRVCREHEIKQQK